MATMSNSVKLSLFSSYLMPQVEGVQMTESQKKKVEKFLDKAAMGAGLGAVAVHGVATLGSQAKMAEVADRLHENTQNDKTRFEALQRVLRENEASGAENLKAIAENRNALAATQGDVEALADNQAILDDNTRTNYKNYIDNRKTFYENLNQQTDALSENQRKLAATLSENQRKLEGGLNQVSKNQGTLVKNQGTLVKNQGTLVKELNQLNEVLPLERRILNYETSLRKFEDLPFDYTSQGPGTSNNEWMRRTGISDYYGGMKEDLSKCFTKSPVDNDTVCLQQKSGDFTKIFYKENNTWKLRYLVRKDDNGDQQRIELWTDLDKLEEGKPWLTGKVWDADRRELLTLNPVVDLSGNRLSCRFGDDEFTQDLDVASFKRSDLRHFGPNLAAFGVNGDTCDAVSNKQALNFGLTDFNAREVDSDSDFPNMMTKDEHAGLIKKYTDLVRGLPEGSEALTHDALLLLNVGESATNLNLDDYGPYDIKTLTDINSQDKLKKIDLSKIDTATLKELSDRLEVVNEEWEGNWVAVADKMEVSTDDTTDGCECAGHRQTLLYVSFILVIIAIVCFVMARFVGLSYQGSNEGDNN